MNNFNPVRDRWLKMAPAYGRDYANPEDVLADWVAGKDFLIEDLWSGYSGRYVNAVDANTGGPYGLRGITFEVRYGDRLKVCWLRCQDGQWVLIEKEGEKR